MASREIRWPLSEADAATFSGRAWTALLGSSADRATLRLFFVDFEAGARTHWHTHSGTQILLVTGGRCLVGWEDGSVRELSAGETLTVPPGAVHWHGASSEGPAAHFAVNLDNRETRWLGPVAGE